MATTTEESIEEDEPKESTMAKTSAEESEETMRLSEHLQHPRRRCIYVPRELTTATVASAEEDGPKESATTTEALVEDEE